MAKSVAIIATIAIMITALLWCHVENFGQLLFHTRLVSTLTHVNQCCKKGVKNTPRPIFWLPFQTARSSDECFGNFSHICFVYEIGSFRQFHHQPEFQYGCLKQEIISFESISSQDSTNVGETFWISFLSHIQFEIYTFHVFPGLVAAIFDFPLPVSLP